MSVSTHLCWVCPLRRRVEIRRWRVRRRRVTGTEASSFLPAGNAHSADLCWKANFSREWLPLRSSFWQMLERWFSTVR